MNNTPNDPLISGLERSRDIAGLLNILMTNDASDPIVLPSAAPLNDISQLEQGSSEEFINNIDEFIVDNEFLKKELQCSICFEDFKEGDKCAMLPCPVVNHIFHISDDCSVIPWLRRKNSCPLCRHEFPKSEDIDGSPNEGEPMVPYNEVIINQMNIIGEFLHELHVLEAGDTDLQTAIELSLNNT